MSWCYKRCTELCSCYMRFCDCAACDLLLQVIFGKLSSRNCPQYFGTGPIDQRATRHGGSAAWISRTSVFGRISGTLVRYSSLSELCLSGESVSSRLHGESVGWWSNIILSPRKTGVFQGGSARHVDVASSRGTTRQVVAAYRYRGSTHHVVTAYQGTMPSLGISVGEFYLRRFNPLSFFGRRGFHRICHAHTLTHLRPGPSGVRVV